MNKQPMYYKLGCDLDAIPADYVEQQDNKHEPLIDGTLVDENDLSTPWLFRVKHSFDEGFGMSDYYKGKKLMSHRLIDTLKNAGVDNLQIIPAEIKNTTTGELISDYSVVNIIGLVSCAVMDASDSSPLAGGSFFHKLVIDSSQTQGHLMFRMAESLIDIMVHEKVAKAIQEGNFTGVTLEPVATL